ncbi:MAG: hypothetical protein IKM74_05525 [Bacteroidales bacterium]|nr:hypothetical protein [Bacteroidales bacterium]
MKKLALALVCLISVAFFASCTPEGQPTISVLPGEEYVHDGDIINVNQEFNIGFTMSSSIESGQKLASFTLVIDDETFETVKLDDTEFTFERTLALNTVDTRDDIDNVVITGTVTDVLGKSASVTITLILDETQELILENFEWNRHGGDAATGNLAELGLAWNSNGSKEDFAIITAVEGAELFEVPAEKWAQVTTQPEKVALFSEGGGALPIRAYKGVSAWSSHTYDDVIATRYNGEYYLIHITEGIVSTFKGTDVTIKGEWK